MYKTDIEQKVYDELILIFEEGKDFCCEFSPYCKYEYRFDFYFPELKLAVECDGYYHKIEHDRNRDHYFKNKGILTIRFTGDEIKNNIESVIKKIKEICYAREKNICSN